MSTLPSIAIAGATGNIGTYIIDALLSPAFRPKFGDIIALTRSASTEVSKALTARGIKVVEVDTKNVDNLAEALKGVDVFVDAMVSTADGLAASSNYVKAAARSGVKFYIPSEFGFDHHRMDFEHPVWDGKTVIEEEAVKAGLRLSRVTVVLFLEDSFNPAFGFDIPNSTVTVVGTADSRFSFTAKADIGYSVAGVIALWAENPSAVPHTLHVASDTMTYGEVRDLLSKTYGREFKLVTEDADEYRKKALAEIPKPGEDILGNLLLYLRLLHANGVGDHSVNHNELINPGEKYWKWKKNAEYIEETKSA